MSLNYAGTSISVNFASNKRKVNGTDFIYKLVSENGQTDAKKAFIDAMTEFADSQEFKDLTHALHSDFNLQVRHVVHTSL